MWNIEKENNPNPISRHGSISVTSACKTFLGLVNQTSPEYLSEDEIHTSHRYQCMSKWLKCTGSQSHEFH